jgi:hypothetical protein
MEKWEEEGMETTHIKKKLIQDSVVNEENGCPVPGTNRTMINITKEPTDTHKKHQRGNLGLNQ